jgi:hypothetical protein
MKNWQQNAVEKLVCTDLKYQLDHQHMQRFPGYKACSKHEMKMSWLSSSDESV